MKNSFAILAALLCSCKPAAADIEAVSGGICRMMPTDLSAIEISGKDAVKIDFTRNTVCILNEQSKKQFVRIENYVPGPSAWKAGKLYVVIDVDGKPERFRFDPGFAGCLGMPEPAQITYAGKQFPKIACTAEKQFCVGREFIRCFDWIADPENREVFVHKNYTGLPEPGVESGLMVTGK